MHENGFYRLLPSESVEKVNLRFDNRPLRVPAGVSVAAALLMEGVTSFRSTAVSGARRAPWCMMGVCFECLLNIDGEPNQQACLVAVAEGMNILTQDGSAELDKVKRAQGDE
jgi:aerobic-type carbon monoxide dehydrogenase small subunit (CoxS/CutS family)